ncbi:PepSY-associated TM helix domain-containing protein [Pseudothauera rhizosphaerae]|uniref:PepSY domain-containing protein n=1 Tax=Pseudothauera rhizosphaerae TaxID=2565932 RepID=A0A4S4AU17_9RHOO|nr:PepSY-associated TM helix domain-containing protein [Pseudothauera rhizosphaerae]THF63386.1 PepSY domain-containing protein [Pseudothauera rhizosphaerae]
MAQPKSSARWWFLAHSWLALPIWVFLFFVCLTGSIATVSQEIVWLADPKVRANPPSGDAQMLGYDEIVAVIAREHPDAAIQSISRPVKSMFAWTVRASYPDTRTVNHYVNPYTGRIQGSEPDGFSFRQFIRGLHGWLLMPFDEGFNLAWYAVSVLALPLLGSLITGLVVYKRFWRGFLHPRLRFDRGSRVFWGDLHRLAGIWSIPFILIMAVTGLWFLILAILTDTHTELPSTAPDLPVLVARDDIPVVAAGQPAPRIGLNQAAALMRAHFPDVEPASLSLGSHAFSPITVRGQGAAWPLLSEFAQINPYTAKVEHVRRIADRSGLELFTGSMRPLHTGDFAGLWLKLVYFVFGLLLTLMVASGLLIWTKRTVKATAAVLKGAKGGEDEAIDAPLPASLAPPESGAAAGLARQWKRWRFHLSAVLLALPLVYLPQYLEDRKPARLFGLGEREVGQFMVGTWPVKLGEWRTEAPKLHDGEYEKSFTLALCQDCIAQVKAAYLRIGKPRGDVRTSGVLFSGSPYRMSADLRVPENLQPEVELWLTLEGWDGTVHRQAIPLADASPATVKWAQERSQ